MPVACALLEPRADELTIVAANRQFRDLADILAGGTVAALAELSSALRHMRTEGQQNFFTCWRSRDPCNHRQLDINIALYGAHPLRYLFTALDRTAEALSQQALRREMLTDTLTGFANRTGFEEAVEAALADGSTGQRFGILVIDLARFSRVNDCVGSLAGDELIITVARRLHGALRAGDIIGRIGGNEFAVFARLDDREEIDVVAGRLFARFEEPFRLSDLEVAVEPIIGGALGSAADEEPLDSVRHAQIALKRAKQSRRFERYSADALHRVRDRFTLEGDLRQAVEEERLELAFQPLIDLERGAIAGFEALARWNHPDRGMISPVEFIPIAEESGLVVPLGRWVVEKAASTLAEWDRRAGRPWPVRLSVNLSPVQVARDDVPQMVAQALRLSGIAGERLTLELTESAFISDPQGVAEMLGRLKELGANLAMDDFGTGYSNLASLQQLPLDVLKIDRSFVSDMLVDRDKAAIVRTVLSLADALGMQTTAEGVEDIALSQVLTGLGCSYGQGYFYARPLSAEDAYAFLVSATA